MTAAAKRNVPWMQTASGRAFPMIDPSPADVDWRDIAEALAKTNRFNGHTPGFAYSVAQHCCYVGDEMPLDLKIFGLLHDAHEAYIGDDNSPKKRALDILGGGEAYRQMRDGIDRAIYAAARLPWPLTADVQRRVHFADMTLLATEKRDLCAANGPEWTDVVLPPPLGFVIRPWPWPKAMEQFLDRLGRWLPGPTADRDVPPGKPWVFKDHRTLAEVARDEQKSGGK